MKNLLFLLCCLLCFIQGYSQKKQTYQINGTNYIQGEYYKTTNKPKVQRSSKSRQDFLTSKGYSKVPNGYHVDHIIPLSKGGSDTPSNMQLISKEQHKQKTSLERKSKSNKIVHTGSRGGQYYYNSKGNKTYIKKKH